MTTPTELPKTFGNTTGGFPSSRGAAYDRKLSQTAFRLSGRSLRTARRGDIWPSWPHYHRLRREREKGRTSRWKIWPVVSTRGQSGFRLSTRPQRIAVNMAPVKATRPWRRHLDASQRAMAAAALAKLGDGQRADYAGASIEAPATTQAKAASLLNVSRSGSPARPPSPRSRR